MGLVNPSTQVIAVPANKIDQILDIQEGSFFVGAGSTDGFGNVTEATADDIQPTWQGALYLVKGIWSHDAGNSWHEFGNSVVLGTATNGVRTLSVSADNGSTTGIDAGSDGTYDVSAENTGASGYTIEYKILFLARPDTTNIPVKQLIQPLRYSSKYRYMKIFLDDSFTVPTSGQTVIHHGLGYVPNVNCWILLNDPTDGFIQLSPLGGNSHGGGFGTDDSNSVTENDLIFNQNSFGSFNYTIYYRVYLDA